MGRLRAFCNEKFRHESFSSVQRYARTICDLYHFNDTQTSISPSVQDVNVTANTSNTGSDTRDCSPASKYEKSLNIMNLEFIVDVCLIGIICLVGIVGNSLSIVVMRHLENRVVSLLFTSLAMADNAVLVTCFFLYPLKTMFVSKEWRLSAVGIKWPYVVMGMWPIASAAQLCTVWLVVLITADRYLALCRPFSRCRLATRRQAGYAIVLVVAVSCAFNLPRCFEYTIEPVMSNCEQNVTVPSLVQTELLMNTDYFITYNVVLYVIFMYVVPLTLVTVLNVKLIQTLRVAREESRALTHNHPTTCMVSRSNTRLLVAMVTVFILCELPDSVFRILFLALRNAEGISGQVENYLSIIGSVCIVANSAVNCLIYSVAGRQFRRTLIGLVCCHQVVAKTNITAYNKVALLQRGDDLRYQMSNRNQRRTGLIRDIHCSAELQSLRHSN